ncbi:MAG TPA: nicotinamide-nucleotide amidohydrolase family protein, partial [Bacteroidota bacterium]|nr:nicotinamide-nucleotide amidohydrolase family protein [Bacteroidota bacterium]
GVRLRITVHAQSPAEADGRVREVETRIRARVARYIYGVDDEEMESVLGGILASRGLTIAVAESCTGGLIAHRLTGVSGSSAYVERCLVTYSNASKTSLLGVDADLIAAHGAVSREVALAMARGVRSSAGTDIGLSTTGIAGPTGGTPDKPVGTVWIGIDDPSGALAIKFLFSGTRLAVKERAAQAAMELVRRRLLKLE